MWKIIGNTMKLSSALGLAATALFSLLPSSSQAQHVTITKNAMASNPGLYLADFKGPADIRSRLLKVLTQSDWFTVLPTPDGATYKLQASYVTAPAPALEMSLTAGTAGTPISFRQTTRRRSDDWLLYQAVDTLISKVFKNPGLCASNIAFANGRQGFKEIFSCNFDGTNARQVTFNRSISTEPSWNPRATSLVYTLYSSTYTDVVLADLVNQRQRKISEFPGLNAAADLSPDGLWAALCLSRDRQVELYRMRVSDRALTRLTSDKAVESSPTWSPNGSQICYVSDKSGKPNLYVISAGGGSAQRLIAATAEAVSPCWSKVSNKICFATKSTGDYSLAIVDMNASSREATMITPEGGRWESPSWAPDGRHIVSTHQVGNKRELCMVDSWYGRIMKITTAGDYSLPDWSELHD